MLSLTFAGDNKVNARRHGHRSRIVIRLFIEDLIRGVESLLHYCAKFYKSGFRKYFTEKGEPLEDFHIRFVHDLLHDVFIEFQQSSGFFCLFDSFFLLIELLQLDIHPSNKRTTQKK